jgi:tetratricopeptide (TPR) repeat protein
VSVSFSYDNSIECPECETTFSTKTWIIIDSQEQPNLWEQCRIDTIHCYLCPPGHAHRIQDPLLLHDAFSNRLLFSPSKVSSQEQAAADFQTLTAQVLPNLPPATRDHFEERLQIVNRDVLPLAMANLDPEVIATVEEIYQMLSRPFDASEAADRIELSEYGLSMFTREQAPFLWGTFVSRLASYIQNDPRGNHGSNVQKALRLRIQVLSTFQEHQEPIRVATEQMNLGISYAVGAQGFQSDTRDQAIALIEKSLEVFLPRLFPDFCALANYNLGTQYLRTGGNFFAEDTEKAIAAFEEGAKAITPMSNPKKWGDIYHNLGIAYHRRIRGNPVENQECAIAAYEQALKVQTVNEAPHERVLTQMDLGNALLERTSGERAENIEHAIEAYSSAAALSRQNGYEVDWARLQYDLSYAYFMRIRGTREDNLQKSIEAGQLALNLLTRERFPVDWGNIQQNLGNAYRERARPGYPEEIEQAIESYTAALSVRSPERSEHPERSVADWAATLDSLASAYAERMTGDPTANQEKSIQLMEQAASMDFRKLAPRTYVRFLVNLGSAYRDRQSGVVEQNREKAVEAFQTAIELATQQHSYEDLRRAVLRLALLRSQYGEWEKAYEELINAARLLDQTYASAVTDVGKEAQAESNWFLYQMLSEVCLHISRPRDALVHAEEGRARVLRDELAMLPIPLPGDVPNALLNQEQEFLHKIRHLDLDIRNTENVDQRTAFVQEAEKTRIQLEKNWAQLARYPDGIEYVSLRQGDQLSWEQLQKWVQSQSQPTALVEYVDLRERLVRQAKLGASCRVKVPVGEGS